ncbi:hypothetical protein LCGC14_1923320 [marine sediment metagenome]|uniref:Uncharacterized protein n=1 Tax=marine sediment metagenome TaxID=412755 RepID=A0A0F9FQV0_9ZZZZ
MRFCTTLKCSEFETGTIAGSFRHCQEVIYAIYGRQNIVLIQFYLDGRWIDSPYLVNKLEAYR